MELAERDRWVSSGAASVLDEKLRRRLRSLEMSGQGGGVGRMRRRMRIRCAMKDEACMKDKEADVPFYEKLEKEEDVPSKIWVL
eukprot:4480593-Pyramimonas_sp.AAC.1